MDRDPAPDADALEQSQPVVEERSVLRPGAHDDDVPEADWLEQSVAEPIDDDER
jgi:hypothetical protein